jgi:hypothetical protein
MRRFADEMSGLEPLPTKSRLPSKPSSSALNALNAMNPTARVGH